ncbi:hypothetical protein AOLI_G00234340 [Acnodon oligacanthus]
MRYKTSGLEIHGYESGSVSITCSHSWAGSNRKYFCKDPCKTNEDVLIDSAEKSSGRYQLTDSGTGVFTVEVAGLNKEDAGKYWCGVDRVFGDTFTEVILTVLDAPQTSPPPSSSAHLPTTAASRGNISASNATFAAAPATSDQPNDPKIPGDFGRISQSVRSSHIGAIPVLLKKKRGNPSGKQSSVYQSRPPATEDTEPDYENICTATTKFPAEENIYSNQ